MTQRNKQRNLKWTMRSEQNIVTRINGDDRDPLVTTYLNLSSGDRDRASYPSSNDCTLSFDEIRNALRIDLLNFEIPHTRYAIDHTNNTFYLSEKISDGEYNFFGLKASTGGYTITNLAVSLELSTKSPTVYSSGAVLQNSYNLVTSGPYGKVAVISSGTVEYNIHCCIEILKITEFQKTSDTEAVVTFLAPFENIIAPGALLTLRVHNIVDREIQVIANNESRSVTVIGDFSDFADSDVTALLSTMIPYSSRNCVSEVAGFGLVDLNIDTDTQFEVLAMGSPFGGELEDGVLAPMVLLDVPAFLSSDDYCKLINTVPFMDGVTFRVGTTHDDTHFEIDVDPDTLFAGTSLTVSSGGSSFPVDTIVVASTDKNTVVVQILPTTGTGFEIGDIVTISGLTTTELDGVVFTVSSTDISSDLFNLTFQYITTSLVKGQAGTDVETSIDAMDGFEDGTTWLAPVNPTTGIHTTYISPNRFDLSRGRRVIICKATIDEQDIGTMFIPNSRDKFFARIQLFSGADLVNFLGPDNAVGHHKFNSVVKRLHDIRFRFYNENGTDYEFVGVEYTLFLKITSVDSNTGL